LLRQRSRPYLFSNTLAPAIAGASVAVLDMLSETTALRDKLESNTTYFREKMTVLDLISNRFPSIVPVMLYDAKLAQEFAQDAGRGNLCDRFLLSCCTSGKSCIRVQISAGHEVAHLDKAIAAFTKVGKELGVIK
jgi:glycine C-acetyltransferase